MIIHNIQSCIVYPFGKLLGLISIKWTKYVLLWISYHLIPFIDLIILNEGIKIFIYMCGGYLCVEAIKSFKTQ